MPGDFSSAAFWLVAAAALPGSRVEIEDVGLNPTRTALLDVLRRFGARVDVEVTATDAGEPRGTVSVEGDRTGAVEIAPDEVPGLIDELPAIAALAAHGGAGHGARRRRAAREGERPHRRARRRLPRARHRRRRAAGRLHRPRPVERREASRRAASPTRAAITGWRWRSRSRRSPPKGRRRIDGADVVAISYPGFFETLDRLVA